VKRIILVMFTVLLVSAVIFGGCAKEEAPTTPTTPTTPTEPAEPTEPTEPVKPIEWTFASFIPPFDIYATQAQDWAKGLEEATDGRMTVTFYWAESLVKLTALFEAVASGTADMAQHPLAPWPERLSLTWVWFLPGIFDNPVQTGKVMLALFDKYEEMNEQFLPARVAWLQTPGPFELVSSKPVQTMEDLKGLKVQTGMKYEMLSYEKLGAVPVPVHVTEAYHALETGVVEASSLDFNAVFIWRMHEVTKYRIGNTLGIMSGMPTIMNIESYNKLPSDVKQIFDEQTNALAYTNATNEAWMGFADESIAAIKEYDKEVGNPEFYYLPAEEHERWAETIRPIRDVWVEENEAKGYPARAILDDAIAFAAQYK
jgi:TRAP-type C4-dicarboxylate transport system substrate-binding protein